MVRLGSPLPRTQRVPDAVAARAGLDQELGVEAVLGAEPGERRRRGDQLHVRRRVHQRVGVLAEDDAPVVEADQLDAEPRVAERGALGEVEEGLLQRLAIGGPVTGRRARPVRRAPRHRRGAQREEADDGATTGCTPGRTADCGGSSSAPRRGRKVGRALTRRPCPRPGERARVGARAVEVSAGGLEVPARGVRPSGARHLVIPDMRPAWASSPGRQTCPGGTRGGRGPDPSGHPGRPARTPGAPGTAREVSPRGVAP